MRARRVPGGLACLALACLLAVFGMPPARPQGSPAPVRRDGAVPLFVPSPPASAQNPTFLDSSSRLAFTLFSRGYNDGPASLWRIDVGCGRPRPLLTRADTDHVNAPGSSFHRKRQRLVFSSDRLEREEIWTLLPLAPGGAQRLRRVTRHADRSSYVEPTFSPDGRWIVFERRTPGTNGGEGHGSLWKVREDGTGLVRLWPGRGEDGDARQPNWSPDGQRILFQRREREDGEWSLWTVNSRGRELRRISPRGSSWTDGTWSPDSRRVVASSDYGNLPACNLFVLPATPSGRRLPLRLTHSATLEDAAPSWAPEGWVAFESHALPRAERARGRESPASLWGIQPPRPNR